MKGKRKLIEIEHAIFQSIRKRPIECQKYNYSLDKNSKNFNYQESDIIVDSKQEEIYLMHFKPTESAFNADTDYV